MLTDRATFRPILRPRSMKRLISRLTGALALFLPDGPAAAEQEPKAQHDMVRVFLDCNRCDEDYLKKEVTFIDYVRNREDADGHVLVTNQGTSGGGSQWTLGPGIVCRDQDNGWVAHVARGERQLSGQHVRAGGQDDVPQCLAEPGRQRHRREEPDAALVARRYGIGELTDLPQFCPQDP